MGLNASADTCSVQRLAETIAMGDLAIVSVKWAFRPEKSVRERTFFWKKYGGHLAVVVGCRTGVDGVAEGFFVHHPSTTPEYNWESRFLTTAEFGAGYTGRAVVIGGKIAP
jgi:hypothetical protein